MRLEYKNLDNYCRGIRFLGSGGGGNPDLLRSFVQNAFDAYGPVSLLDPNNLYEDDLILPIEFIGAPVPPHKQREPFVPNLKQLIEFAQNDIGLVARGLMPVEIGGANALTPFCVAGSMNLPVLNGDLLGRALPELTMISTNIKKILPSKAYLGHLHTQEIKIIEVPSYEELEEKARNEAKKSPHYAVALIPIPLKGSKILGSAIPYTITRALSLGSIIKLEELIDALSATVHCVGTITDWAHKIENGFLIGTITIKNTEGKEIFIDVKNEYLKLWQDKTLKALVPDLIILWKEETREALASDQIKIGDYVTCLSCKGPKIWYSKEAKKLLRHL